MTNNSILVLEAIERCNDDLADLAAITVTVSKTLPQADRLQILDEVILLLEALEDLRDDWLDDLRDGWADR